VVVIGQNQEKVFALMQHVLLVDAGGVALQWTSLNHTPNTEQAPRMRPLQSLTLEAMLDLLSTTFARMPESRQAARVNSSRHDTLMSGVVLLFFPHPSLLACPRKMKPRHGRCTLETLFGVHAVPSDTQRRAI
jgi:hypothetical protein